MDESDSKVDAKVDAGNVPVKEFKTKDYVRRANNKYRKKKYNEDEEYRKATIAKSILNYEKNKEKIKDKYTNDAETKERRKLYMRQYRARKKTEKQLAEQHISGKDEKSDSKKL